MSNSMHALGVRIVADHQLTSLPGDTKILCKASTNKNKFGEYAFGMDASAISKLNPDCYIIHVDVRTKTIGGSLLKELMEDDGHFPIIENTRGVGRCIYWSSHKLSTLALLTEAEVAEILQLREQRKNPKQQNLFL
jgi:hypothetical protein